jgi:flagellin-specific chaperone FliS
MEPYARVDIDKSPRASQVEIVQVLIVSALHKIDEARSAHQAGRPVEKGFYLGRATVVVDTLRDALDVEGGGTMAQDFDRVYEHIDLCLQLAVTEPDAETPLASARDAISQLSACWHAANVPPSLLKGTA